MGDPGRRILIVVPARGGSKGLPGKNLATVAGVSLVGRAVLRGREFIARSGLGDSARVVVDTDDPDIAEEGLSWGASVPFLRPASLAADDTSTADSLVHLIERLDESWSTIVRLQPTLPLARAADVSACWARFRGSDLASVVSTVQIAHPPSLALIEGAEGTLEWWAGHPPEEVRRQAHAPSYWPSGAVYVVDVEWFLEHRRFLISGGTAGVPLAPSRAIDIDDRRDLEMARLQALLVPDASIFDPDPEADDCVVGGGDIRDTVERIMERVDAGVGPSSVLLASRTDGTMAALAQIPAIGSIFGLPVLWESEGGSRETLQAARMLGARVVGGDEHAHEETQIEPEWFDMLRNR
jgi:N-acylneuraminate cytidylyltransferase